VLDDYRFEPERFAALRTPTLLLLGSESPAHLRQPTEALHAALPDSQIAVLPGQRHDAIHKDPDLFTDAVLRRLLDCSGRCARFGQREATAMSKPTDPLVHGHRSFMPM
jgi:pimeloyl-ACP methyl ester carboxylesterase